ALSSHLRAHLRLGLCLPPPGRRWAPARVGDRRLRAHHRIHARRSASPRGLASTRPSGRPRRHGGAGPGSPGGAAGVARNSHHHQERHGALVARSRSSEWTDPRTGVVRFYGAAQDITERKRADEALRHSEQRYRTLIGASSDGIVVTDLDANIVMVNQEAVAMHGCERSEELVGKGALEF